ncbi:MAG: WecB/TagA/CpsF family glycosyltransferase [Minisyncoccia bacterium]
MEDQGTRKILDIKITSTTTKEVLENIKSFLLSDSQHRIITLNPEMVMEAQKDSYFKKIINESDLSLADGIGIVFANLLINREILPERTRGVDLIYKICGSDFAEKTNVYLIGAGEGIAERAAKALAKEYPYLQIVGAEEGIRFEMSNVKCQMSNEFQNSNEKSKKVSLFEKRGLRRISEKSAEYNGLNKQLIQRINNAQPDIIFVAFGAPKQEKWIYENIKKIPSVKLAIGVGGSFDFISGKVKRAPLILRKIGLEWLWRLMLEPRRIGRIFNATVKFGLLILKNK